MDNDGYERHKRVAFYCIFALLLTALGYFFFFKLLLPIVAAWLIALLLQPLIRMLSRLTGISRRPVALTLYFLILALLALLVIILANRFFREISELISYLAENGQQIIEHARGLVEKVLGHFGFIQNREEIGGLLSDVLAGTLGKLSDKLTAFLGGFVGSLPKIIFSTVIFMMAAFYLTVDFESVERSLIGLLPKKAARTLGNLRSKLAGTVVGYVRAYLMILCITFAELLIAFSILGVRYALLLSVLISILDILPAIGVGTVLLPWACVCFFVGNSKMGIGLLVVFGVVALFRQIIEPHIVGSQLGLSPLVSLLSVYVGYRLAGLVGILLAPIAAILLREALLLYKKE